MKYSTSFRNAVLKQVLPPHNRSVASVARERGLSAITIHNWIKKLKDGTLELDKDSPDVSPDQRNIVEKFQLLMESKALSEEQLGEWIRKHGLHTEHLSLWESELEGFMKNKDQDLRKEVAELRKYNKELKKEAKRDKAAMAEALALLTLKKKVDALLDPGEEE
jgi:transposase-like protein